MLATGVATASITGASATQQINGNMATDLIGSYEEASQLVNTPPFVPRTFQNREFIG